MAHRLLTAAVALVFAAFLFVLSALLTGDNAPPGADKASPAAMTVSSGSFLQFQEPEINYDVLAMISNDTKTKYAMILNIDVGGLFYFPEVQFFDTYGKYEESIFLQDANINYWDWEDNKAKLTDSLFRLETDSTVYYYDFSTNFPVDGQLLCSDGDYDLVGPGVPTGGSNLYQLVENGFPEGDVEIQIKDTAFLDAAQEGEITYRLDSSSLTATIEANGIYYTLKFKVIYGS